MKDEDWCVDKTDGLITLHAPTPVGSEGPIEVCFTDDQATRLIEALAGAVGASAGHRAPQGAIPVVFEQDR